MFRSRFEFHHTRHRKNTSKKTRDPNLGGGLKFVLFSSYLGKIPILTNIFQMGWNHHLANIGLGFCDLEPNLQARRWRLFHLQPEVRYKRSFTTRSHLVWDLRSEKQVHCVNGVCQCFGVLKYPLAHLLFTVQHTHTIRIDEQVWIELPLGLFWDAER